MTTTLWVSVERTVTTTLEAKYYVEDDLYGLLQNRKEVREIFLKEIGESAVSVERMGRKSDDGSYIRNKIKVSMPDTETDREVGYFSQL